MDQLVLAQEPVDAGARGTGELPGNLPRQNMCRLMMGALCWSRSRQGVLSMLGMQPELAQDTHLSDTSICCAKRLMSCRLSPWKLFCLMNSYRLMDSSSKVMHRWFRNIKCSWMWIT